MRKKIFNDKLELTKAVLNGSKTQFRSFVKLKNKTQPVFPIYNIGDIVAVAQSYEDIHSEFTNPEDDIRRAIQDYCLLNLGVHYEQSAGFRNKMFVKSELMPHQIYIEDVRYQRLQDISDEDCLKEGVHALNNGVYSLIDSCTSSINDQLIKFYNTPREAYAELIDKMSNMSIWDINPFVFAYDFKLIK